MKAHDVEMAVAWHFGYRRNIIVPNVSWGWDLRYEADMVVLRPSGWAVEVEIKVSGSDIKADTRKWHMHHDRRFRQLWFAVPVELANHPDIPARAGVLAVDPTASTRRRVAKIREAAINPDARKITEKERVKLLHLGLMRIWRLKAMIQKATERDEG